MDRIEERPGRVGTRPWWVSAVLLGGLILAIAVAGFVALVEIEQVRSVTQRALRYDLEVEDEGDDLRVAILDVRHHHRNIVFNGASDGAVADFEAAYAVMLEEIGELELVPILDPTVPQPERIRELIERYYADFRPAVALHQSDPQAFQHASDEGLRRIEELDKAAAQIDRLGEVLTEASLGMIDESVAAGRFTLIALEGGLVLMSVLLVMAAVSILARLHASYALEQAAAEELGRTLRSKTDFVADASHELRTPLTVIRGNAEIGLRSSEPKVSQEVLAEIVAEATRMNELVDDLIFLARSDAGRPPLDKELVPIHWLLSRLEKPAEVLAQQRGSCLKLDLDAEGYLDVDPARVEQAVLNLVDNAAKHTPPGTNVVLATRAQDNQLTIEVADAGPGIPPEELPLIFERFYRVGNHRIRKKDGSGLGLAIAKTIVESHGGSIKADSRVDGGTRMTIRIPLCATLELATAPHGAPVPA